MFKLLTFAVMAALTSSAGTIVNINALTSGENAGNQSCSITCNGSLIAPIQVTLGPGSYQFNDAWNPTTGLAAGALYDAWNFQAGNPQAWAWHWKVFFDDGSNGSTVNPSNYSTFLIADVDPTEAFTTENAAAVFGFNTAPVTLTLNAQTTLDFVVNDNLLGDNAVGVSLNVVCTGGACLGSSVPEPSGLLLIPTGLTMVSLLAWLRRRSALSRTSLK